MLLSTLYFLVVLTLCVLAVGDWLRLDAERFSREVTRRRAAALRESYLRLARPWVAIWFLFQLIFCVILVGSGNGFAIAPSLLYFGSLSLLLPFLVAGGIEWTRAAGSPVFPWLRLIRGRGANRQPFRSGRVAEFLVLAFVPLIISSVLFLSVNWSSDPKLDEVLKPGGPSRMSVALLLIYLLVSAAVIEELLFRHYLLNRLLALPVLVSASGRARAFAAMAAVTFLWTIGHGGMVEPAWLKYAQITVYGIALGIAQLRLGLEACVVLHLLYNGMAPVLVLWLKGAG